MATHSVLSLKAPASAAVGLTLLAAGHATGWPILRGGAQALPDALARYLEDLGGRIETGHEVTQLPEADLILADITPRQLLRIAASQFPPTIAGGWSVSVTVRAHSRSITLSAPIPWAARECSQATTVHLGGSLEEIVESERTFTTDRPFVLLG
jgi:phytoene dehydrogenase-like protein